ncbi:MULTISPECIES: recombination mediator RecR [Acinetobacter]|uniref:recombination mediator RecR n=1 Tax=Acinetobacter TaxID=469 RepID=UPI002574C899|nr:MULTISPECIES: recombination mediator RecR [Acinetobacter]MDM1247212.1 recombination protein RecR [Acinetobacter sp. R933-2]MDM1764388.1 recombination protein RecR [Acinetobacter sp. 226-1]MDM1767362.1 recombination protein RecR [Acinetobacter sp. 226-4]MDQ9021421.1 recombination mediator RecR [Acinetobacter sichuanensis]
MFSNRFDQLVQALRVLPSVGPKSAQRMALHLIMKNKEGAIGLANALNEATSYIHECAICHSLTENDVCDICSSHDRDEHLLCVVESPADVMAIEQSGSFRGKYHVLGGHLSPLDGIGPEEIGIPYLVQRLSQGEIHEVILATNATVEGQATAHYLVEATKHLNLQMTRIAQGVPQGGELEYVDSHTLSQAVHNRMKMK